MGKVIPFGFRRKKGGGYESMGGMPEFEHDFPEDFVLVVDTREQDAMFLSKPPKGLLIVRDTLKFGDYSIKGFEDFISVERKNIDDLWSSLTTNAQRFKAELDGLKSYERKWILIEGLESDYLAWNPNRKIHPNAIRWALASIEGRMGIPIHPAESRRFSERWMLDVFIKYFSQKRNPK